VDTLVELFVGAELLDFLLHDPFEPGLIKQFLFHLNENVHCLLPDLENWVLQPLDQGALELALEGLPIKDVGNLRNELDDCELNPPHFVLGHLEERGDNKFVYLLWAHHLSQFVQVAHESHADFSGLVFKELVHRGYKQLHCVFWSDKGAELANCVSEGAFDMLT